VTRAAPAGPSALAAVGHVVVLCAFAVAQPLFDLLGSNPTFFVAHEAGGAELVVLRSSARGGSAAPPRPSP